MTLENQELREHAQRMRVLDERRRELIANVSHELKTPLSIILGLAGRLLSTEALEQEQAHDAERIRANAYVLLKHVEDLLQAASLDSGRTTLARGDCDLAHLVREVAGGFASVAEQRDQQLVVQAPDRLPARVDEEKVLTVVSNLLANALKFTPTGGLIRCTLVHAGERVRLEVADSGPGVPASARETVFERFRRVDGGLRHRPGGTGLGLAIVRELVTLHGGTVTLRDAHEGGALFAVELPFEPAMGQVAIDGFAVLDVAERERPTIERLKVELQALDRGHGTASRGENGLPRVLLVEESAELGARLEELLAGRYTVVQVAATADALGAAEALRPDAVLLDLSPDAGDAQALVEALRTHEGLRDVPVVVLADRAEDARRLLGAAAHDYALKPFAGDELVTRLDNVVARRRAELARSQAEARFAGLFEHAPIGMAVGALDGGRLRANAALARMLGRSREELLELAVRDVTHPDDVLADEDQLSLLLEGRIPSYRIEKRFLRGDGTVVWGVLSVSLVRDDGSPRHLVLQLEDVTDRLAVGSGPRRGDERDALTGLPERDAFERLLANQLARCERYGERAALLLLELDSVQAISDELGQAASDRLVAEVARTARRRLRQADHLSRLGDGRFGALVVNVEADEALEVAHSLCSAVNEAQVNAGDAVARATATAGVCAFDGSSAPERVLVEAEMALGAARAAGPGEVRTAGRGPGTRA